ncbi:MAG: hypothetical protein ABSF09_12870 [Candidatus Bathyarchaeia archaeon]|jgi:hypothetical protein
MPMLVDVLVEELVKDDEDEEDDEEDAVELDVLLLNVVDGVPVEVVVVGTPLVPVSEFVVEMGTLLVIEVALLLEVAVAVAVGLVLELLEWVRLEVSVTVCERTLGAGSVATTNKSSSIKNDFESFNPYQSTPLPGFEV